MIFRIKRLTRIGNSKGITIPKEIIRKCADKNKDVYVHFMETHEHERFKQIVDDGINKLTDTDGKQI